jgi:ribosomal protein S18 acetylase RimI-like enzyme
LLEHASLARVLRGSVTHLRATISAVALIRHAEARDAAALVALWDDAYADGRSHDGLMLVERALADDHLVCVVAEAHSTIVGSLIAGFDGWRGNLYRLAVAPQHRGQGIAQQLLAEAHRALRDLGAGRITAIVDRENAPAVRFWESSGYCLDTDAVRYVGP